MISITRSRWLDYSCFDTVLAFFPPLYCFGADPSEYNAPAMKTIIAPKRVPWARELPKSQMLSNKLTSFLIFSTIVTVRAEDFAASTLTPRMQAYWVSTLMARYASWLGNGVAIEEFTQGIDSVSMLLCIMLLKFRIIDGTNGRKRGNASI